MKILEEEGIGGDGTIIIATDSQRKVMSIFMVIVLIGVIIIIITAKEILIQIMCLDQIEGEEAEGKETEIMILLIGICNKDQEGEGVL